MPYQFSKFLLLRMPLFPVAFYSKGARYALEHPQFRAAVRLASPLFYQKLEKAGFNFEELTVKERQTLLKYFNPVLLQANALRLVFLCQCR